MIGSETLIVQVSPQASLSSVGRLTLVSETGREGCTGLGRDRVKFLHSSFCSNYVTSAHGFSHFYRPDCLSPSHCGVESE